MSEWNREYHDENCIFCSLNSNNKNSLLTSCLVASGGLEAWSNWLNSNRCIPWMDLGLESLLLCICQWLFLHDRRPVKFSRGD